MKCKEDFKKIFPLHQRCPNVTKFEYSLNSINYLAPNFGLMSFHTYVSRPCLPLTSWIVIQCNSRNTLKLEFLTLNWVRNNLENPKKLWNSSLGKCIWGLTCILLHTSSKLWLSDSLSLISSFFKKNCIVINEFGPKNFLEWLLRLGLCNSGRTIFLLSFC